MVFNFTEGGELKANTFKGNEDLYSIYVLIALDPYSMYVFDTCILGTLNSNLKRITIGFAEIFIYMKQTIIITPQQAKKLLYSIPQGKSITLTVKDANRILDSSKPKGK